MSFVFSQSADPNAAENLGSALGQQNTYNHVEMGLDVSVDGSGTVSATDGKAYLLVPQRTAQWTTNSGQQKTATRHRVGYTIWYEPSDDPQAPHSLPSVNAPSNVYLVANLNEDNMPYLDVREASAGTPNVDGYLLIARISVAGTVTHTNQAPDAEFDSLTVGSINDQNGDPIFDGKIPSEQVEDAWLNETGDTFTGDLHSQDAKLSLDGASSQSYIARDSPELEVVLDEGGPHTGAYEFTIARGTHPEKTADDTSVFHVGSDAVTHEGEPLATEQWAKNTFISASDTDGVTVGTAKLALNALRLNGQPADNFLRTDIEDDVYADTDWHDSTLHNVEQIVAGTQGGPLLDLEPNSDGTYIVWRDADPQSGKQNLVRSNPASGRPFVVQYGNDDHLVVKDGGNVEMPSGDVFSQDGMLASHNWANDKFLNEKGGELDSNLDFDGFAAIGVSKIEFASSSGTALDLRPNSDGDHILWQHDNGAADPHEFFAQLNAADGVPWLIRDNTRNRNLIEVHDNGYIAIPYGGLATDGPIWMGTHNYFGDDTTHDIIWKQDNDGTEGHMHMHAHEVEIFPNGNPGQRTFWTDVLTGETGIGGDTEIYGSLTMRGSREILNTKYMEYQSFASHAPPPTDVGMRVYYYNNSAWAVNDAGDRIELGVF